MELAFITAVFVVVAAAVDLRTREIPDAIPIALVAAALATRLAGWHEVSWTSMAIGCAVGCIVPGLLCALGAMGGGDVKLLGALGFGFGWESLIRVLYWTALAGGLLAVGVLALRRFRGSHAAEQDADADPELAYGPAIAVGYLVAWGLGDLATAGAIS